MASEEHPRYTPQKVLDQDETEQVGGTVINRNLNRDENKLDVLHGKKAK